MVRTVRETEREQLASRASAQRERGGEREGEREIAGSDEPAYLLSEDMNRPSGGCRDSSVQKPSSPVES